MRLIGGIFLTAVLSLGLQACGSDSGEPTTSNAQNPTPAPSNRAPTISGAPPTEVVVGQAYDFTPQASDPEGATLTFSIQNRPAWATFSSSTGRLSGTPSVAGVTQGVRIAVTDGTNSVSLPAFNLTVSAGTAPPPVVGSATLNWQPPTERTDGSALANLAGYRIYYGNAPGNYSQSVNLTNPGLTSYVIDNLTGGTWYFTMTAVDSAGLESARTNPVSKTIS
ncbi:MAG TPA: putative Ig domain-containing protein [Steroidobacteraceae bacterium]|nr:putative Ig domain-containing protein [Steroidobacteraceae bacterium]HNS28101.1 putative Ig domain-containing protein [Steroidobacteraceae bacterium]